MGRVSFMSLMRLGTALGRAYIFSMRLPLPASNPRRRSLARRVVFITTRTVFLIFLI